MSGVLVLTLNFGNINRLGKRNIIQNPKVLIMVCELALLFFMTITSLTYGYDVIQAFAGFSIVLSLMPIVIFILAMLLSF